MSLESHLMSAHVEVLTYSLVEVAPRFPCSERWLAKQIRDGKFKARKICGHWRMTDEDINDALEQCRNSRRPVADGNHVGLTTTSRRRVRSAQRGE